MQCHAVMQCETDETIRKKWISSVSTVITEESSLQRKIMRFQRVSKRPASCFAILTSKQKHITSPRFGKGIKVASSSQLSAVRVQNGKRAMPRLEKYVKLPLEQLHHQSSSRQRLVSRLPLMSVQLHYPSHTRTRTYLHHLNPRLQILRNLRRPFPTLYARTPFTTTTTYCCR